MSAYIRQSFLSYTEKCQGDLVIQGNRLASSFEFRDDASALCLTDERCERFI